MNGKSPPPGPFRFPFPHLCRYLSRATPSSFPFHSHTHFSPRLSTNPTSAAASASHRRWKSSPPVKGPFLLLVFLSDDVTMTHGVSPCHRFSFPTLVGDLVSVRRSAAQGRR
jgi:hypothetical protein